MLLAVSRHFTQTHNCYNCILISCMSTCQTAVALFQTEYIIVAAGLLEELDLLTDELEAGQYFDQLYTISFGDGLGHIGGNDGGYQCGIQILGGIVVFLYVFAASALLFKIVQKTIGLRVSAEDEMDGLDISEHGFSNTYTEVLSSDGISAPMMNVPKIDGKAFDSPENAENLNISKVVIIARKNKLDALLHAMNDINVTGVTITDVTGYGIQKGNNDKYYRSSDADLNLLPKVKVEVIVSTVPVSRVVETAEKVLYSGNYGDGKIFVYDVKNVVKVRTGEVGREALIDESK